MAAVTNRLRAARNRILRRTPALTLPIPQAIEWTPTLTQQLDQARQQQIAYQQYYHNMQTQQNQWRQVVQPTPQQFDTWGQLAQQVVYNTAWTNNTGFVEILKPPNPEHLKVSDGL